MSGLRLLFIYLDHLNSIKVVTDKDAKVVVKYEYRAFGEQLKKLNEDNTETGDLAKYSYGGKELDDENDLYYFNARYYDATIGRFINVDPIQDGTNWYIYCSNNPLNMVDPTGLEGDDVIQTNEEIVGAESNELSSEAQALMTNITNVLDDEDVQNGVLDANGNPGTWCNRAVDRIAINSGADMSPALAPMGIDWTSANTMTSNLISSSGDPSTGVTSVTPEEAQNLANQGILIIAAASNTSGSGHVAIVAPTTNNYNADAGPLVGQAGPLVGQAGTYVGFYNSSVAFGDLTPSYYRLPEE